MLIQSFSIILLCLLPLVAKIFVITVSPIFFARPSFLLFCIVKNPSVDWQRSWNCFSVTSDYIFHLQSEKSQQVVLGVSREVYAAEFMSFQGLKKNLFIYWFSSLMYSVCCKWRLHAWGPGYGNLQYLQFYLEHCCSCLVFSWPVNILCKTRVTFT